MLVVKICKFAMDRMLLDAALFSPEPVYLFLPRGSSILFDEIISFQFTPGILTNWSLGGGTR